MNEFGSAQLSARINFRKNNSVVVSASVQLNFVSNKTLLIWFLFLYKNAIFFLRLKPLETEKPKDERDKIFF